MIGHDVAVDRCEECQFDYEALGAGAVPSALRSLGGRFGMRIANDRGDPTLGLTIRTRPAPRVWSALEYACHMRDVFLIQRERLYLALVEECPSFAKMYRDERAVLARYGAEDPDDVIRELKVAAEMLAWAFEGLDETQLQRRCIYNFPEPTERNVLFLGRQAVHEGEHHLRDIDAGLRSAAATVRTASLAQDPRSHPLP
ncbi:MAG: DinB family protein [Acidimicrobiales bacterium]